MITRRDFFKKMAAVVTGIAASPSTLQAIVQEVAPAPFIGHDWESHSAVCSRCGCSKATVLTFVSPRKRNQCPPDFDRRYVLMDVYKDWLNVVERKARNLGQILAAEKERMVFRAIMADPKGRISIRRLEKEEGESWREVTFR